MQPWSQPLGQPGWSSPVWVHKTMPRPSCYGTAPRPPSLSHFWSWVVGLQQSFATSLRRAHPSWDAATAAASGTGTLSQSSNAPAQPTAQPKPEGDSLGEASDSMKTGTCSWRTWEEQCWHLGNHIPTTVSTGGTAGLQLPKSNVSGTQVQLCPKHHIKTQRFPSDTGWMNQGHP